MSATRLLMLGVVRRCGRAHGYRVRAELTHWGAEDWAYVKWGSIYHALRQLAKEGMLQATVVSNWPGRVDYELTDAGEEEFLDLLRNALRHVEYRSDTLGAALALLPALSRAEAIGLLKERLVSLDERREHAVVSDPGAGESHLLELSSLSQHNAARDAEWTRGLMGRLEHGDHVMAGEEAKT